MSNDKVREYTEEDLIKARNEGRDKGLYDGIQYCFHAFQAEESLNLFDDIKRVKMFAPTDRVLIKIARRNYDQAKKILSDFPYTHEEEKKRLEILGERLIKTEQETEKARQTESLAEKVR